MFSVNALQVRKALKGLYDTPQNNFRVALNGINIYNGNKCSVNDKEELNKSIKDFFSERFEFPYLMGENKIENENENENENKNENENENGNVSDDEESEEEEEEEEEEGKREEEKEEEVEGREEGKEERGVGGGEIDVVKVEVAHQIRKLREEREERKYQCREKEDSRWIAVDEHNKKENEKIGISKRQCIRNDQNSSLNSSKLPVKQRRMTDFFMNNAKKAEEKMNEKVDEKKDDNDSENKKGNRVENRIVSLDVDKKLCKDNKEKEIKDDHKDKDDIKDSRKDGCENNIKLRNNKNKNINMKYEKKVENKIKNNKEDMKKDDLGDVTASDCLLDMLENILLSEDTLAQVLRFQNLDLLDIEGKNEQ